LRDSESALRHQDAMRAIEHAGWLTAVPEDTGLVLHELPPLAKLRHP